MSTEFNIPDSALKGLREAAQRGTLIPFIGAGASRLAGSPDWMGHANEALKQFVANDRVNFSHAQLDQLHSLSARVKLSIALALQYEHNYPIDHSAILHPKGKTDKKGLHLYSSLSKLAKTFVTTNYDQWLDEYIESSVPDINDSSSKEAKSIITKRNIHYEVDDFTPAHLNQPNTVIHLHGSIVEPKSMVFTTQHYVKHYANDRNLDDPEKENRVLTFLDYLFDKKSVLFIGYGLEELEILEYVILKARRIAGENNFETKHFIIQGFFSHQRELMLSMKNYYQRECGIELIDFVRDEKDWDMLLDVVDCLAEKVPASNLMVLQEFKEMEDLLNG